MRLAVGVLEIFSWAMLLVALAVLGCVVVVPAWWVLYCCSRCFSRISVVPGGYSAVIYGDLPRTTLPAGTYVGCLALLGHVPQKRR